MVAVRPVMAVPHFLIACWMYYREDSPMLKDTTFDDVLIPALRSLPPGSHPHQLLITDGHLAAGTGFDLKFPAVVEHAAAAMRRQFAR